MSVLYGIAHDNGDDPYHEQVVKVIWHKAASPPHIDGSVVFIRWRQCAPYLIWFPGPIRLSIPICISIGSAVFVQLTAVSPHTLQWTALLTPQNCFFTCGDPNFHLINGISTCSAVLLGSRSWQTDRQTDHATPSATIGRIYGVLRCGLKQRTMQV